MKTFIAIAIAIAIALALLLSGCASHTPSPPEGIRQAERYMGFGVRSFDEGDYQAATAMFAKAQAIYRSMDHTEGLMLSSINLAEAAIAIGSFERAQQQIAAAESFASLHGESRFAPRVALLGATALYGKGQRTEALARVAPLLQGFESDALPSPVTSEMISAVILRTRIAFDEGSGDADRWTQHLELALKKGPESPLGEARLKRFRAQSAMRQGNLAQAQELLAQALVLYRVRAVRPGTAATLAELGQLAREAKNWNLARDYLERALYIRLWILDRPGACETLVALKDVYTATGQMQKAQLAAKWSTELEKEGEVQWKDLRIQLEPIIR